LIIIIRYIQVSPNTPSHNKLYAGDGVTAINGQDASSMKHEDAENLLRNALQIQLTVRRYVVT
ncbi:unnamed protein product, partial [Rotaria socialis]